MNLEKANDVKFSNFKVNEDYPKIKPSNLDKNIIYKLIKINSGNKGEFTSLNQYMYQHFILVDNKSVSNIYEIIEKIAIAEMIHFKNIAQKLKLSNTDPKYCKYIDNNVNLCDYWSGQYVDYVNDIEDIITSNIKLEKIAIEDYNNILNESTDENLNEIINRILKDEHSHLNYFSAILNALRE
jgi:Mn-containing catalase